jgi:hypothetical protein
MKALAIVLAFLTLGGARASEFSVRCEGKPPAGPYFATFDTDAKAVVFETASRNVVSPDGSNVLAGEISKFDEPSDGKIEFAVRTPDGKLSLTYDSIKRKMVWPGISSGDPFRPTLTHSCVSTPPRSILGFRSPEPIANPITVQCQDTAGYQYFTMDLESKKAVFERGAIGRLYGGEVASANDNKINLLMRFGGDPRPVSWDRSSQVLTVEGFIQGPVGGLKPNQSTMQCQEIAPRTMIEYYKMLK